MKPITISAPPIKSIGAFILTPFLLLSLLCGCLSIDITSTRDSKYASRIYHNLLVVARFTDITFRMESEQTFKDHLLRYANTDASVSVSLLPPTGVYTEEEIRKPLLEGKFDGVLLFRLVSPTHDRYLARKEFEHIIDAINYSSASHVLKDTNRKYEVSLVDAGTGKTVWFGFASISSKRPYRSREIVDPLAMEAIRKLQEEGLLSRNESR